MGEINMPGEQQEALAAIDIQDIDRLVEAAIRAERSEELRRALLGSGPHIDMRLRSFENALAAHCKAKAARKRTETASALRHAGYDLSSAVRAMKQRMATEQRDSELFFVEDSILPPYRFSKRLTVRVSYRWRQTSDDPWRHGNVTFSHDVDLQHDYTGPTPKRKPSAAQQERDLQDSLAQTWEHLMRGALYSVRDYLKAGGDGDAIPDSFQTTVDAHSRALNNYSTQFWRH